MYLKYQERGISIVYQGISALAQIEFLRAFFLATLYIVDP